MRIYLPLLLLTSAAQLSAAPPPIIDMHMHAAPVESFGMVGIKACPGDVSKTWPAVDPRDSTVTPDDLEDCPNPDYALESDDEVYEVTKQLMEKHNITGVLSGPEHYVRRWALATG